MNRTSLQLFNPLWGKSFAILMLALVISIGMNGASRAQNSDVTQMPDSPDIVGGTVAEPGSWPWQVSLVDADIEDNYYAHLCGGTLIADDWVLTAAHCVERREAEEIEVLVGQQRLSDTTGERIAVDEVIAHPNYQPVTTDFDIALLHLSSNAQQPTVALYRGDTAIESELAFLRGTIIGWGSQGGYLSGSDRLRQVSVPLVSHETCNKAFAHLEAVTNSMLCTGYEKGGKGSCYGDSGGPLVVWDEGLQDWQQVGIVNWGRPGCQGVESYSVFARVAVYTQWVDACLEDSRSADCLMGDEYETDDSRTTANEISVDGALQEHNFHHEQDIDWFKFSAEKGVSYLIDTDSPLLLTDTLLWLYDQDGVTPLAYNDDQQSDINSASLLWKAPATGTYYFQVEEFTGKSGPIYRYTISVRALPHTIHLPHIAVQQ
ncbi:MAG: trypsin-like serine protease [Caldilineaceae bacterium]|nr:trypsin-like serine protease [Caldilineaceae bacterium]